MNIKILFISISVITIIFIIGTIMFYKKSSPSSNISEHLKSDNKTLKYFGGERCPHSKEGSKAHILIKAFEEMYPDVNIEYYWSSISTHKDEFKKARADYVPTITNDKYKHIELKIGENISTIGKSDIELKNLVLENVYNNL